MRILYHLTILPPRLPGCEAVSQEIELLRTHFNGDLIYVNPNQHIPLRIPRLFFGLHLLNRIRGYERHIDLHHFFNPDPFAYPMLHWLRRPVVYSITGSLGQNPPRRDFFRTLAAVTVPDEQSLHRLQTWGIDNGQLIRPGIDTRRFTSHPLPLEAEFRLLVASAPWTKEQFRSKGIDALLATAQQISDLRLIFLWRGVLGDEMARRVHRMNLENVVTVLDEKVDVNRILAGVHATAALAGRDGILRSYPHSLLDSLAAGKPVLISRTLGMADYVERQGCGTVVDAVSPDAIVRAVTELRTNYSDARQKAEVAGQRDFSQNEMLASVRNVYRSALGQAPP